MLPLWLGKIGYIITRPGVYVFIRFTRRSYVVIRVKDEVIVTKDWLDMHKNWRLPGGGVKRSESPQLGAKREVKEEVGLNIDVKSLKFIKKGVHPSLKYHFWVYELILDKKPNISINRYELAKARWVDIKSLNNLPKVYEIKQYLDKSGE